MSVFRTLFDKLDHLPVSAIRGTVAHHMLKGAVPIITSEVASGKTMLIPAAVAELLAEDSDQKEVVYVLVPTRFLANNAVDSLWELLGDVGPSLVGCLNGQRSDDASRIHPDNRVIFTTVGYALASGLIDQGKYFILDEAHELSIDMSLVKALLHRKRKLSPKQVHVAIMSATLDVPNEVAFWEGPEAENKAITFSTPGTAFKVTFQSDTHNNLVRSVSDLLQEGSTGVLVFVEGRREGEDLVAQLNTHFHNNDDSSIEVMFIHGGSSGEERRRATALPKHGRKILVGTNVLESGISLPWVNGGVSNGNGKVLHVTDNIHRLVTEPLPQWRIEQQKGRVGRFGPGAFVLTSNYSFNQRALMQLPEIQRLPLTELVLRCARTNIHPDALTYTASETPDPVKVQEALTTLLRYGFVEHNEGRIELTNDGKLIRDLPLSFRGAAAYCEAVRLNCVSRALPLIALLETGDIRQDFSQPVSGFSGESDYYTPLAAIHSIEAQLRKKSYPIETLVGAVNISARKYREYQTVLATLEDRVDVTADYSFIQLMKRDTTLYAQQYREAVLLILFRAFICDVHTAASLYMRRIRMSRTSHQSSLAGVAYTGMLRTFVSHQGVTCTVLENVTSFTNSDYSLLARRFGEPLINLYFPNQAGQSQTSVKKDPRESENTESAQGTLGDILAAALKARK